MKKIVVINLFLWTAIFSSSCKHEVVENIKSVVIDTTGNNNGGGNGGGGNGNGNGGGGNTNPCDPSKVYFVNDVLPIFLANCAYSGCHDAGTAADGVILDNYFNIISTGGIIVGNAHSSEVYEKITETDPEDIMPPAPKNKLSESQIATIARWINDGAQNTECNSGNTCDTVNVGFQKNVLPILNNNCIGCHSGTSPSGGISLQNYTEVKKYVNDGSLLGSIKREPGWSAMPKNRAKMSDCNIRQIEIWVNAGAPNN